MTSKNEDLWKLDDKRIRDFLAVCFAMSMLVPLTLGMAGPFSLLGYCLVGWIVGCSNTRRDVQSMSALSAAALFAALLSIDLAGEDSLPFIIIFFVASVLAQTEAFRRLSGATGAARASTHFKTAQILLTLALISGSFAFAPWAHGDVAAGLIFTVVYSLFLLCGCYLAMACQAWRKLLAGGPLPETEEDLSL